MNTAMKRKIIFALSMGIVTTGIISARSRNIQAGNYDDFMLASVQARERVEAANAKAKDRISDLQEFVRRFSANASKARQATSRLKQIDKIKKNFLYIIIGIAFLFSLWQSQQRKKLKLTEGFGEKLRVFTNTFGIRLWWHLVLASAASFLFVLTGRNVFLYFGILDIVLVLLTYPAKPIFRQELDEEDIVFLE